MSALPEILMVGLAAALCISPTTRAITAPPVCATLCKVQLEFSEAPATCEDWLWSVQPQTGSHSGLCECAGSGACSPETACNVDYLVSCLDSDGKYIWERVRCGTDESGNPLYVWYCQLIASPFGETFSTHFACYGCGCDTETRTFEGYSQDCSGGSLNQCANPPSGPPTGFSACTWEIRFHCPACSLGNAGC